jgi:ribosomal protein L34E
MKPVTKRSRPKPKCAWCGTRLKPQPAGRPALFCSASCRQRAYEKRKWARYSASDALALNLLPPAALRKVTEEARHKYMIELLANGTVPLDDTAQIDGVLDTVKPQKRLPLLGRIETACRHRADGKALATIARWRLSQQQPSSQSPVTGRHRD